MSANCAGNAAFKSAITKYFHGVFIWGYVQPSYLTQTKST